jgi:hypothetical protein
VLLVGGLLDVIGIFDGIIRFRRLGIVVVIGESAL